MGRCSGGAAEVQGRCRGGAGVAVRGEVQKRGGAALLCLHSREHVGDGEGGLRQQRDLVLRRLVRVRVRVRVRARVRVGARVRARVRVRIRVRVRVRARARGRGRVRLLLLPCAPSPSTCAACRYPD